MKEKFKNTMRGGRKWVTSNPNPFSLVNYTTSFAIDIRQRDNPFPAFKELASEAIVSLET